MPPTGYNMPPAQPPKKSNRTWIACCAVLLVVALCVLVVGGYYAYRRGTNFLSHGAGNFLTEVANPSSAPGFINTAFPPSFLTTAEAITPQNFLKTVIPPSMLSTIEAITPQNLITTPTPGPVSQVTPNSSTSQPQGTGTCSYNPPAITASGVITKVTMALDTQGATKNPVNPTTVFSPSATIHAVVAIQSAPTSTSVKAVWYATSAESVDCNTKIGDPTEIVTDGTRNIDFTLAPESTWPTGSYRVEIYINNNLDQVVEYTVQ